MPNCVEIPILHTIYMIPKLLTTWLTQFCAITHPNSFIFNLTYTTRTNTIFRLNLNYKKAKNVSKPPPYLFPT